MQEQDIEFETSCLLDRKQVCPVCGAEFRSKDVKSGKVRTLGSDTDLRPRYEKVDILKYGIIMCTSCGYAAYSKNFKEITESQKKVVREKITPGFKNKETGPVYTYDDAILRYRVAFANAMVMGVKTSQKANVALRLGWVLRGKAESLDESMENYQEVLAKYRAEEDKYLKMAFDGFMEARQVEDYPIAGMDQPTLDFLIGALSVRYDQFEIASRLLGDILLNKNATDRMKDKARDLRDEIAAKMKAAGKQS